MGDSVAAEEALTSDKKAIREYWEAEVGIIKVLETKLNSSQRTWKRRIVSDIITVCHGNILTAGQRLVDVKISPFQDGKFNYFFPDITTHQSREILLEDPTPYKKGEEGIFCHIPRQQSRVSR